MDSDLYDYLTMPEKTTDCPVIVRICTNGEVIDCVDVGADTLVLASEVLLFK